ncbi:unnamed protein product [Rodentolepis nana]|uniref:Cytochrome b561 domain-containing protein n=1 Tax=Rodentolepis nana TaxID=102285 RepID=A0A0R3TDA9_RODNA|nr:unnamed protein product [Rodentolepis nana]
MTRRGLWRKCTVINATCEMTIPFISESDGWQGAATCILLVAIFIGLLGTGLAIFGHSGSDLVQRLYYFHSSGEIFFLAGFITFLTFGIYRSYANLNLLSPRQTSPQPTTTQDPHHSLVTNATSSPISSTTTTLSPQLLWQVYYGSADIVGWCGGILFMVAAVALLVKGDDVSGELEGASKIDEFLHELTRLGHTRWPSLALFLHWGAVKMTSSNRRIRNAHRRCLQIFRRNPPSASSIKIPTTPATTSIPDSSQPVSYRPTTGASMKRHKRWRLHRQ